MRSTIQLVSLACVVLLTEDNARGAQKEKRAADVKLINEYSVQLLQAGKADEALELLQAYKGLAMSSKTLGCPDRAIYFYNMGQAAEELSSPEAALRHFVYSFELCATFQPALLAALRSAEQIPDS